MPSISDARRRTLALQARTFKMTEGVLQACPKVIPDLASREVWRQLVRSACGSAGNLEEADEASSDADFVNKMKIALRETRETRRWLRVVMNCRLIAHERLIHLEREAGELSAIFATIVIRVKARLAEEPKRQAERRRSRTQVHS